MDIRRKHRSDCEHVYVIGTSRVLSPDRTWPDCWLNEMVPQVRARTSPGVFHDMALLGLCLELSFYILYCRTQANPPTLIPKSFGAYTSHFSVS